MSDTAIAIVVVPLLVALTLALECTRIGCTWLGRKIRAARNEVAAGSTQGRLSSQREGSRQ